MAPPVFRSLSEDYPGEHSIELFHVPKLRVDGYYSIGPYAPFTEEFDLIYRGHTRNSPLGPSDGIS